MLTLNGRPTILGTDVIISGDLIAETDVLYNLKTVIKTIDINPAGSDDFVLDNTQANQTEQPIDCGAIIPAYAMPMDCQLRCFETVTGSNQMSIDVGISSGGDELLFTADVDTTGWIHVPDPGSAPLILPSNTAQSVWVNFTPGVNWNTPLSEGRWSIMIAYIDYAQIQAYKVP